MAWAVMPIELPSFARSGGMAGVAAAAKSKPV